MEGGYIVNIWCQCKRTDSGMELRDCVMWTVVIV